MFGSRLANTFCDGSLGEEEMIKTRKSLWAAGFALLVCIVLLIGTTFAWFTDSVSNSGNRIQAGSLNVDLLMDKEGSGNYTSIANGTGDIFSEAAGNGMNWEPGKTEIVYLGVQNKGSLALNYNIVLDITDGEPGLVGSLEYAVLDGVKASDLNGINTWQQIVEHGDAQTGDVTAGEITAAPNGTLDEIVNGEPNETEYFALAVHMKEDAGNAFQNGTISIDVNVVAKQATAETDGFGSDRYDADSRYEGHVANEQEFKAAFANAEAGDTIILDDDISITNTGSYGNGTPDTYILADNVTIDLNGKTLTVNTNDRFMLAGDNSVIRNGEIKAGPMGGSSSGKISYSLGVTAGAQNVLIEDIICEGGIEVLGNGASATLRNVHVTATNYYCIYLAGGATATVESGEYNAASGKVHFYTETASDKVVLKSGTFSGGQATHGGQGSLVKE